MFDLGQDAAAGEDDQGEELEFFVGEDADAIVAEEMAKEAPADPPPAVEAARVPEAPPPTAAAPAAAPAAPAPGKASKTAKKKKGEDDSDEDEEKVIAHSFFIDRLKRMDPVLFQYKITNPSHQR